MPVVCRGAKGKLATADSHVGDLLREREEHQRAVKTWDLARKEQKEQLAHREEKAKTHEADLSSREGTAERLEKREAEVTRLVTVVAQERELLDAWTKKLATAEQAHQDAVQAFRASRAASEDEREKDVLAQVDLECDQLLVVGAVHAYSQILRIDPNFKLDKLLDEVSADLADCLASRVKKDAEAFAETFEPLKMGADGRPVEPAKEPPAEETDGEDSSSPADAATA